MADFVIERIYDCLSQPDDFIYEVLEGNNTKKYRSVHGQYVYGRVDNKPVYRLLPPKMISIVGDYYQCLRQRPDKKTPAYKYNKRYAYKIMKLTLAQFNIAVLPSRMWAELAFGYGTDHQLQPYTEWMPGCNIDLLHMHELCGFRHIPIGSEMIYAEPNPKLARPAPCALGKTCHSRKTPRSRRAR
jgi:hypothetical protein